MQKIQSGLDQLLLMQNDYKDYRIALVTNNAALTSSKQPGREALLRKGFNVVKLFSPEHGLLAVGEDGTAQNDSIDPLTALPVISLYSDHFMPTADDLAGIDLVIFDIPDVGCRFYTYLWTMTYVMEACAMNNKPLVVLDRTNLIGGNLKKAEGPFLDEKNCSSFIGRWNIPIRHSCTVAELAKYFSAIKNIDVDLRIIQVNGWKRNSPVLTNPAPFEPPSPAILNIETALCYPGTGLLEGIHVNEGRGTSQPFTTLGAPWIDNKLLKEELTSLELTGVQFSETEYIPSGSLYAGKSCFGLKIRITDEEKFSPVHTGLSLIGQLVLLFPEHCRERLYKTAANPSGEKHLDKLTGVENSLEKIMNRDPLSTAAPDWQQNISSFLLYN